LVPKKQTIVQKIVNDQKQTTGSAKTLENLKENLVMGLF
jgi:hypothetical protein